MLRHLAWITAALCASAAVAAAQTAPVEPLKVVVTIKPVHALALQVLEGIATPQLVVAGTASPHTYALKPSDARLFHNADIVVRVSETLEPFTTRVVASLPAGKVHVVTLERAAGMTMLPRRTGATFEAEAHAGHSHGHSHGNSHATAKGAKAALDGHLWLDPRNAKVIVAELARVASSKAPAAAALIAANAAKATARLDALDAELAAALASSKGKPYAVFHDAYQYFEVRYGLAPVGAITVDPEVPPSAKRLADLRAKVKRLNAGCVFGEPGYETKVVQSIVEGTAAKLAVLDPEGLNVPAGVDAYQVLMQRLAAGFQACLAPKSPA